METTNELNFFTALLPLAGILFIIAIGVILLNQHFQKNLYKQKLIQEELVNQHRHELLKSSIQVQEEERKRIASDLHDELGATLSIARMHLLQLEKQQTGSTFFTSSLENIRSLTESSLASMRRISHELMPPNLVTFGLINALQDLASKVNSTNEIYINIDCPENSDRLPWEIELGLYRICLELVNNTLKHAEAKQINLELSIEKNHFTLHYEDDGSGLEQNLSSTKVGLGHKSIEARVTAMEGVFKIIYSQKRGFIAQIDIPLVFKTVS